MANDNDKVNPKLELHMGIPNGVILTLIGILVLITPLVKSVPRDHLTMDLIAGGVLTAGGIASFILGIKRSGRVEAERKE